MGSGNRTEREERAGREGTLEAASRPAGESDHDALPGKNYARLCRGVEIILDNQIRPLLKIHGGGIDLLDVSPDGDVRLEFQGACRGCALKSVTYALAVRHRLRELPGVREVEVDGVRLSDAALNRVERFYAGYSFWAKG